MESWTRDMAGGSVNWRKSTRSSQGNCVEVAGTGDGVLVRDTKDGGQGAVLAFTSAEWSAFLAGAAAGEFALDVLNPRTGHPHG
jgi:Domain of unknown function (DUF397)